MRFCFAMLLFVAGLAQAPSAVASDGLAGVRDRIEQPEVLRGRVEQPATWTRWPNVSRSRKRCSTTVPGSLNSGPANRRCSGCSHASNSPATATCARC